MALSLKDIRSIARDNGYEEIGLNENSRLISFRGGPSKSTRINIYYTTGTVGTCLNHPKRGKTQLFRRNISSLDQLGVIFSNPRVHTGRGYFTRKNIRQQWRVGTTDVFVCDSMCRWMYVGPATGLVQNNKELETIGEICYDWDRLYWDPDMPPHIYHTRFACGSHGGLLHMLYEVVRETRGDFETCSQKEAAKYLNGEIDASEVDNEVPYDHVCPNVVAFREAHLEDIDHLKDNFMSLRKDIRIELAQWFLCRDVSGYVFTDLGFNTFTTKYTDALIDAHKEYGQLMYPKKTKMCNCCGVLRNTSPDDGWNWSMRS